MFFHRRKDHPFHLFSGPLAGGEWRKLNENAIYRGQDSFNIVWNHELERENCLFEPDDVGQASWTDLPQDLLEEEKTMEMQKRFKMLSEAPWKTVFTQNSDRDWSKDWFLDGEHATVDNSPEELVFSAGPQARADEDHAVLWTRQVFDGSLKVEYEFTRLDEATAFVGIRYLQATGSGEDGYDADIAAWSERRRIPAMNRYFRNMHTYHISYAAYGTRNTDPEDDYVRARRYRPDLKQGLRGTELEGEFSRTWLFKTGQPHRITVLKHDDLLFMQAKNLTTGSSRLFYWRTDVQPAITSGRIGLRHMYTRSARYGGFRVSTPDG